MPKLHIFVGCLNREAPYMPGARGKGITVYSFDEESRKVEKLAETGDVDNPTYLSVDEERCVVYANSEVFAWREGMVSAYRFDPASNVLTYLNKQPTLGSITAHNSLSVDRRFLLVANYAMGEGGPDQAVAVFPIREDGGLDPACSSVAHPGSGPDDQRQERSHAHCVLQSPDGGPVLVADLGTDKLVCYSLSKEGRFASASELAMPAGSGPRHMAFHPGGRWIFVMNELDSSVSVIERRDGGLALVESLSALPDGFTATSHGADIHVSPDGRFVYASNRGHDSIAIFAVDTASGRLRPLGHSPSGGATPRNFALTPSGRHMLVANQDSDNIRIFSRNAGSGSLTDTGAEIAVGTPLCVKVAAF